MRPTPTNPRPEDVPPMTALSSPEQTTADLPIAELIDVLGVDLEAAARILDFAATNGASGSGGLTMDASWSPSPGRWPATSTS